jgi:hypothetical protein
LRGLCDAEREDAERRLAGTGSRKTAYERKVRDTSGIGAKDSLTIESFQGGGE